MAATVYAGAFCGFFQLPELLQKIYRFALSDWKLTLELAWQENIDMKFDFHQFTNKLNELFDAQCNFATITQVSIRGSAPQIVGAKAVVTENGIEAGTIGGGKIEAAAIVYAQQLLQQDIDESACELVTWNLQTDIGMTCGGEVQLLFEVFRNDSWPITVFGAGHISQQLIPLLLTLNCKITWIDPRSEWLERVPNHRKLTKICVDDMVAEVAGQREATFFVLMTKGHASDLPILAEILKTRTAPYVGVIGSAQKASVLRRNLKEQKFDDKCIESFFCPMGKPLGNNTPAEIAVSVVSQLIEVRDQVGVFDHKPKSF